MIGLEINDAVVVEQKQVLEQALSTNPKTQKALQKLVHKVIMEARKKVVGATEKALKNDPRHAARSIRTAVYKKILGANINIYNSRKTHGPVNYTPPRTLTPGQRGGNRRTRTSRDLGKYGPLDRGFILRWVNEGMTKTDPRVIRFTENEDRKIDKWNRHPNTGNRGAISARHFFKGAGERALAQAADNLANLIDTELMNILNKKK